MGTESRGETFLPDVWQFFGHHPTDKDWTLRSYRLLGKPCSSTSDFWTIINSAMPFIERSMVFCMRDPVMPTWDDPACINGSLVSVLVSYDRAASTFIDLCMHALGETLLGSDGDTNVVGVSMSPKRMHCVIKVWTGEVVDAATVQKWSLPRSIDHAELRIEASRKHILGKQSETPASKA